MDPSTAAVEEPPEGFVPLESAPALDVQPPPPPGFRPAPPPEGSQFQQDIQSGAQQQQYLEGVLRGDVRPQPTPGLKDIPLQNYDIARDKWTGKGTATFFAQSLAATQDTSEGKLKVLAKYMFPDEPEGYKRFAMVDGIPVYVDDGGKFWAAARGDVIGTTTELAADLVGKSPTIAGDIALGAAGGKTFGAPGMFVGGAAGAMFGEYGRQLVGQGLTGEGISLPEIGKEGSISAVTGGIGGLAAKWLQRGAPKGWAESMSPLQRAEMEGLDQISTRLGGGKQLSRSEQYLFDRTSQKLMNGDRLSTDEVRLYKELQAKQEYAGLTPAEASNMRSLKGQQRFAGNVGRGGDVVDDFLSNRAVNNEAVWDNFTMKFGGDGIEEAGDALFLGSAKVIDEATAARAKEASPWYKKAFKKNWRAPNAAKLRQEKEWIMSRVPDEIKNEAQAIYNLRYGKDIENIEDTLVGWHYMKMAIDDRIEVGFMDGIGETRRFSLNDLRKDMLNVMDKASDDYAKARKIYADESPGVMKVREGILGRIFKEGERGGDAYKATMNLLDRSRVSPREVEFAMAKLRESDPVAADKAVGAFLQVKFIEAARTVRDEWAAPRVARSLYKDRKQRAILKASMTDGQFKEFEDIMMFFEAQGRAPTGGSATAWNEFEKSVAARAGVKGKLAAFGEMVSIDLVQNMLGWLKGGAIEDHAEKIALAITSPNGMDNLRRLNKIKDSDMRRMYKWLYLSGQPVHAIESEPEDMTSWGPMP